MDLFDIQAVEFAQSWFDEFNSGHLILDKDSNILFCNQYVAQLHNAQPSAMVQQPIANYLSKASNIFLDTYIYPILQTEPTYAEGQMSWIDESGVSIPIIVNIKLAENGTSFWSLYVCVNRDKLHNELIQTRDKLVDQTKNLYALATTDSLTGLLNRRELLTQAKVITTQVQRPQSTFVVLALDVDHFKQVNDTYGHQVGDEVLVLLAQTLSHTLRKNDLVARVGGEEFLVVLCDITLQDGFVIAEKIRQNIASCDVNKIQVTVSIGVASSYQSSSSFSDIWKDADAALYQSKHTGRNKTTLSQ